MGQIASGQITITDLNDGRTFISGIKDSLNSGGYFSYNPDNNTYTPNLKSGVTLEAFLHTSTSSLNILTGANSEIGVSNIQWFKNDVLLVSGAEGVTIAGNRITLTESFIFPNTSSDNLVRFTIKFNIQDKIFGVTAPTVSMSESISIQRVKQGVGANFIKLLPTPSNTFVNAGAGDEITIDAKIFKSGLSKEPIASSYQWQYYNDEAVPPAFEAIAQSYPNADSNSLTLVSDEIFGSEIFRYLYDFDEDGTFDEAKALMDSIVILDYTDPITVKISCEAGNVFRPGMSTKTLIAEVWEKIDNNHQLVSKPDERFSFVWNAYDKNGVHIPTGGFTTTALASQISVDPANVNIATTYVVSVSQKITAAQQEAKNNGFRKALISN